MRSVTRYRILVDGRLTSRLVSGIDAELELHERGTVLVVEAGDAAELDALLRRLGDLGVTVVSLEQDAQHQ
jgi:hypothetical protein